ITSLVDNHGTLSTADDIDVVASGTLVKTGGDQDALLETGETWTYTVNDVTIPASSTSGSVVNTATVSAHDDENTAASDSDTATVTYTGHAATIDIQNTVDANRDLALSESKSVAADGVAHTADYRYVLTNTSPAGANDPLTI